MARYAAIDIGSNSIRMQAAEVAPGAAPRILASERQVTRLGESAFRDGAISREAIELACGVLRKMAEQYRKVGVAAVRAVATSAVRDARNQAEFLDRASEAAGVNVEVISGREEARLIQAGVHARWPQVGRQVVIVDIGGGSAEIIASDDGRMLDAASKPLGAVRLKEMFLRTDPPSPLHLHRLEEFIDEKISAAARRLASERWDRAVATSATASAVACAIARIPRSRRDEADRLRVSASQVRALYRKLSRMDLAARREVTGIGPRRAEIIVAGVAVLLRIMESLRLPAVHYSNAGVRDGVIADLAARGAGRELSRLDPEQRREVQRISLRYGVARRHAHKVAQMADAMFHSLEPLHRLPPVWGRALEASAYLHDIGHFVNDASHHKHSYYLVSNSDLSGFTSREREFIANLCRYHRKAMPSPAHTNLQPLNAEERSALSLLVPLLRLADSLDRSHDQRIDSLACSMPDGQVLLELHSAEDIDLEQWAAERVGDLFQSVYGRAVRVARART